MVCLEISHFRSLHIYRSDHGGGAATCDRARKTKIAFASEICAPMPDASDQGGLVYEGESSVSHPVSDDDGESRGLLEGRRPGEEGDVYSLNDAIEGCGLGVYQYQLIAAIFMSWAFIAAPVMTVTPFLMRGATEEYSMSNLEKGLLGSAAVIGALFGGPCWRTIWRVP